MACCASSPTQAWTSPRWGVDFARLLEKLEITTHSALHIEQAADGMHGDHRSLDHPKGWTGAPKSMLTTHILQGSMRAHTSYLKREQQPGGGSR